MRHHFYLTFCFFFFFLFTMLSTPEHIKAGEVLEPESIPTENSLGGMSQLLTDYYNVLLPQEEILLRDTDTTSLLSAQSDILQDNQMIGIANTTDFIPVYYSADTNSIIVGRMYEKDYAIILKEKDNFYQISSGEVCGFVPKDLLLTGEDAIKKAISLKQANALISHDSFLYSDSMTEQKIAPVKTGAQYLITSYTNDYFTVVKPGSKSPCYLKRSDARFYFFPECAKTLKEAQSDINCMFWPLPKDHTICTYYGYRKPPIKGASSFHKGLDIGGDKGLPIIAVLSGTVLNAGYSPSRGYYVELSHDHDVVTRYLHCSKLLVKSGQTVTQGQTIALVGSTGISTSPHLHFSLEINGQSKDPYPYLKRVQ